MRNSLGLSFDLKMTADGVLAGYLPEGGKDLVPASFAVNASGSKSTDRRQIDQVGRHA
jgi:hypothetical protein